MVKSCISLVLIVAVLVCPFRCSLGACTSDSCCAALRRGTASDRGDGDESSTDGAPALPTTSCCSSQGRKQLPDFSCAGPERRPRQNGNTPHRQPAGSACQGICGGAVFEKPCELNSAPFSCFSPLLGHDCALASMSSQLRSVAASHHPDGAFANYGRVVRLLHASLLC